jgi:CheY-like chemotaxis protein
LESTILFVYRQASKGNPFKDFLIFLACVTILLPLYDIFADDREKGGTMTTVLVVDDDRDGNDILCRLLRVYGHSAISVFTGQEALDALEAHLADLVILDFMMPGLNGIETLCRIRANPLTARLPVIMYTAIADPDLPTLAAENGANDYFAKGMMDFASLSLMISHYAIEGVQSVAA